MRSTVVGYERSEATKEVRFVDLSGDVVVSRSGEMIEATQSDGALMQKTRAARITWFFGVPLKEEIHNGRLCMVNYTSHDPQSAVVVISASNEAQPPREDDWAVLVIRDIECISLIDFNDPEDPRVMFCMGSDGRSGGSLRLASLTDELNRFCQKHGLEEGCAMELSMSVESDSQREYLAEFGDRWEGLSALHDAADPDGVIEWEFDDEDAFGSASVAAIRVKGQTKGKWF